MKNESIILNSEGKTIKKARENRENIQPDKDNYIEI